MQVIGESTFDSQRSDIILHSGLVTAGSRTKLSVVVGDALAELIIKDSIIRNEDVIEHQYDDIELVSVRCKDKVFPGEGIVVLAGSLNTWKRDETPNVMNPIISRLNKSAALMSFIDSKCKSSISRDRIYSSNSVNLELLRRRYLGIERTIVPTTSVTFLGDSDCDAHLFTEFRSNQLLGRFYVAHCQMTKNMNILYIIPITSAQVDLNSWIRWLFCLADVELVEARYTRSRGGWFLTSLQRDDWAEKFSRSFSDSLQQLVEIGTPISF